MKKILTKDGTETYYNETYDECYHTISGAVEEAQKKFIEPCTIPELARQTEVHLLDICFGLGYNSAAAIDTIHKINPSCKIVIIALENDPEVFTLINDLNPPFHCYPLIKKINQKQLSVNEDNIHITCLLGDAREEIKKITQHFDAIFLDPFSPRKNKDMWNEELMHNIYRVMKQGARVATYSCAWMVRDNMTQAGLDVIDGPIIGRKSPATIGIKH